MYDTVSGLLNIYEFKDLISFLNKHNPITKIPFKLSCFAL